MKDEYKKVLSFENGADDFVSKPFHPDVLTARIRAHIRRYYKLEESFLGQDRGHKMAEICFCNWTLDPKKYQIFDNAGMSAELSCAEFKILHYLIMNCERVVKREELATVAAENGHHHINNRAIDVKITRIRKKIGDYSGQPDIIKTIYGAGYIFNQHYLQKNFPNKITQS